MKEAGSPAKLQAATSTNVSHPASLKSLTIKTEHLKKTCPFDVSCPLQILLQTTLSIALRCPNRTTGSRERKTSWFLSCRNQSWPIAKRTGPTQLDSLFSRFAAPIFLGGEMTCARMWQIYLDAQVFNWKTNLFLFTSCPTASTEGKIKIPLLKLTFTDTKWWVLILKGGNDVTLKWIHVLTRRQ